MPEFKEMKKSDIKILKEKIWLANNKQCPVLKIDVPLDKMVLDHAHKRKDEEYSTDKGVIRTALEFRVNAFFGKIENAFKRFGLKDIISLPDLLISGAEYLEKESYHEGETYFVHPTEIPKREKVKTREYNRVKKYYFKLYPNRKKMIKRPTYITENWKELVLLIDEFVNKIK